MNSNFKSEPSDGHSHSKTIAQIFEEAGGVDKFWERPTRWGNWEYEQHEHLRLLVYRGPDGYPYEIDLGGITSSAACLDWIFQLHGKTWMSPQDCSDLIETLRVLVNPQATLCSCGIERGQGGAA